MQNKYKLMKSINGTKLSCYCKNCCNLQKHKDLKNGKFCVAFGMTPNVDCVWDPEQTACELYNKPFYGLRPRRVPLVEVYGPKEKVEDSTEQCRIF